MGPLPSSKLSTTCSSPRTAVKSEHEMMVKKELEIKEKKQQKSSNNWIYIAVVVVVSLVAGGAVAAVLLLVIKTSSDTTQPAFNESLASTGRGTVFEATFEDYSCGITLMDYSEEPASTTPDNIFGDRDDTPYNRQLECNENMLEDLTDGLSCCDTTFSSLLAANADQEDLIVPCGECVIMDLDNGDTIDLTGGMHIEGMLYFPPSSNINIRTTHMFVVGTLKIDTPHPGNLVKFQLYGEEDNVYVNNGRYPSLKMCWDSCNFGSKPIAIIGGRLEIQAYDPECPSWEKLQDVRGPEPVPSPDTAAPVVVVVAPETAAPVTAAPVLTHEEATFPCGSDDIVENGDFEGGMQSWHNSGNHPVSIETPGSGEGGYYLTASGRADWNNGIRQFLNMECVVKGQEWLLNAKVRLRDGETGNPVSCDPNALHDCPFVRLVFAVGMVNRWFEYSDVDLNWSTTTEWNELQVTVPIEISEFSLLTLVLCGGRVGTIIEVDDVTMVPLQVPAVTTTTMAPVVVALETPALVTAAPAVTPAPAISQEETAFPCGSDDLIVNGDIEGGTAFWHNFGNHPVSVETPDSGKGGQYLVASGRAGWSNGLRQYLNMECLVKGQEWIFNAKVRLTDEETGNPVSCDPNTLHDCPFVRLAYGVGTVNHWFEYPDADLNWSTSTEWNELQVTVPIEIEDFRLLTMILCGGLPGTVLEVDDVTMLPLLRRRERRLETDIFSRLVVSLEASKCWGVGSELLLTSHTRKFTDRQLVTVDSVDEELGIITLTDTINKPITRQDHEVFAVEVASLSRSVVFEAESNFDDDLIGGHLIIYWTPSPQHLEGVEIRNFGQQGILGRYPTHFHFCGNSKGSAMKKNVVRASNQRGYVLHQTNDVLVEDNVAFDILGHCYFLEDGVEVNNTFRNNLGADVKKATKLLSEQSGRIETDNMPSVFWISNAANFFYGNVAAGGITSGFWFETPGARAYIDLGAFDDNSAHSMGRVGFTTYPPGWQPVHEAVMYNINVYRNEREGMFLHVTRNLHFKGGIVADNGWNGVWNLQGDSVTFEGTKIIGVSYDAIGNPPPCGSLGALGKGMILHPTKLQESNHTGNVKGTTLIDVEFLNFSPEKSGCPKGGAALSFSGSHITIPTFDAPHFFSNVLVEEGARPLDACPLDTGYGMDDVLIEIVEDSHASFSVEAQPGFLVSPKFSIFAGDQLCSPYSECLDFCPNACMRTVRFLTNSVADSYSMIVTDGVNSVTLTRVQKYNAKNESRVDGVYNVALPGGKFNVRFEDANGLLAFPDYAIPIMEAAPECMNSIKRSDISIVRPDPDQNKCSDLIKNGAFDADTSKWQEFYVGIVWDSSSGLGQSGALRSTIRGHPGHTLSQWLNTNCLQDGDTYDFTMSFKLLYTIGGSDYPLDCAAEKCPTFRLEAYSFDVDSGDLVRTIIRSITNSISDSTDADGFWTITGSWWAINDDYLADKLKFSFIVTQPNVQFIVDNIHLTKAI